MLAPDLAIAWIWFIAANIALAVSVLLLVFRFHAFFPDPYLKESREVARALRAYQRRQARDQDLADSLPTEPALPAEAFESLAPLPPATGDIDRIE